MSRRLICLATTAVVAAAGLAAVGHATFGSSEATYVVQPGDTLWSIAQTDGITMQQLAAANGMSLSDILVAGRTLVIPPQSGPGDDADATAASNGAVAGSVQPAAGGCDAVESGPYGVLPEQLVTSGAAQLQPLFDQWAGYYGVSAALVEAISWQESGWQQGVVSPAGAVGVGQLLPSTGQFVSEELIGEPLDIYSLNDNIRMTSRFVAYLAAEEGGNLCSTIAAYYEGAANLADYGVLPETRPYVADVEALIPRFE